jgi:pimeloyl-ACP methyl ester carboxylesterase
MRYRRGSRIRTAVALWAAWRLFGPEPSPRFVGLQSRPEGNPGRTIMVGRHEFFVRESGPEDAPPVLLLHGWLYDAHATWHRVVPHLAERFRVVSVDLRNHGKSDRIRSRFDVADLAEDVARLLDTMGTGPLPVVGYSLGGMVAQELALTSPGRVTGLVLGATAARPVSLPRWLTVPAFVAGRAASRLDRFLLPRLAHAYLMRTGTVPAEHGAWLWRTLLDRDTNLYYETGFAILRFDARDRVGSIGVPTTMVVTTDDQLIAPRLQRETASLIPDARVVELEGARHEAVLTHADDIAKAILEALDRVA